MIKHSEQQRLRLLNAELHKLVRHVGLTLDPLDSDFAESLKNARTHQDSQFWYRTTFRCLCACIEARMFTFRKMAAKMAEVSGVQFSREETEILSETRIKGGVSVPKFLSLSDSVKESFRLFAKAVGTMVTVDYGNSGFADLCETFKVRNRLMHPKVPFDVQVTLSNIDTAERGIHWFNKAHGDVFDQCQAHLNRIAVAPGKKGSK